MDKAFLSGIFREIVLRDGELILPFMGCIKLEDVPASFSEGGLVITPPSKKLYFDNYSLSSNDRLLNEYATKKEVSRMAAKRALYSELEEIRNGAESEGRFELEGFGTFCFDKDKGYTIETDPDFMLSRETFGLSAVDLRDEGKKEEERRLAEEQRKAEEARLAEEQRKAEEARLAEEQRKAEEERVAEEQRKAEEARLAEEQRKAEEERIAEEARLAEEQRKAEEEKMAAAQVAEQKPAEKEEVKAEEKKKSRGTKALLWIIVILAILVILVLLILIFKEELRPLLEKILYSKEELEIIHYKL